MPRLVRSIVLTLALSLTARSTVSAQSETMLYDHVHMAVSDPQAAAQWYMNAFGGEPVDGRDERMLLGTTRFIFRQSDDRRPSQGSVIDHLGFSVANLDATLRRLESAGATGQMQRREVEGLNIFFVDGPDAVSIEIVQRARNMR